MASVNSKKVTAKEVLNVLKLRMYDRLMTSEPYEDENGNMVDPLQPVLATWGNLLVKLAESEEKERQESGEKSKVVAIPALPSVRGGSH